MGLLSFLTTSSKERAAANEAARLSQVRQDAIITGLRTGAVPAMVQERLHDTLAGKSPWTVTANPAEMLVLKEHGIRPICAISATCWMHYGQSWTQGHSQGWHEALRRLRAEAAAAGANAVLDVRLHTARLAGENSMDFSLTGTAVHIASIRTHEPIVATVSTIEFVRLIDDGVMPTGIAIGADYNWFTDRLDMAMRRSWRNVESAFLTNAWRHVRATAMNELKASAAAQGNGALAHVNFSQIFDVEREDANDRPYIDYLLRHIIIATVVKVDSLKKSPSSVRLVVDISDQNRLKSGRDHHTAYSMNDTEGGI